LVVVVPVVPIENGTKSTIAKQILYESQQETQEEKSGTLESEKVSAPAVGVVEFPVIRES